MNEGAVYIYVFSFLRCAFAVVLFKYSRMTQAFNNITLRLFISDMSAANDIRYFLFVKFCLLLHFVHTLCFGDVDRGRFV